MNAFATGDAGDFGTDLVNVLIRNRHEVNVFGRSSEKAENMLGAVDSEIVAVNVFDT